VIVVAKSPRALNSPSLARGCARHGVAEVEVTNLSVAHQDAKEVLEGEMCGLSFRTTSKVDLVEGDRVEVLHDKRLPVPCNADIVTIVSR